jgi:hypothetical protein
LNRDADSPLPLYVSGAQPRPLPELGEVTDGDAPQWWQTRYGRWRLGVEREAMKRFPGFDLGLWRLDGRLCWTGHLLSGFDRDRRYLVAVIYGDEFPDEAPEVTIDRPPLPEGIPHLLHARRPCLYHPTDGPSNGYDPGRTTAATLVSWTALWIHAYETWKETGRWPGRTD